VTFLPQYAARAIVDLERQAKSKNYAWTPFYRKALEIVPLMLRSAVQIVLPPNGEIYRPNNMRANDTPPNADEVESFNGLPAPVTCFQYPFTYNDGDGDVAAPKRITMVCDGKQTHHGSPPAGSVCCATFLSVVFNESLGQWMLMDSELSVAEPLEIDRWHVPWGLRAAVRNLNDGKDLCMDNERSRQIIGQWKSDITAVIQCCHALRAGATLVEHTEPSSTRRRKFGRLGVGGLTYHVLTLPARISNGQGIPVGAHASPRFHIRRAHIRKLPTGALTFVRQCFVGDRDRGEVIKTYRVTDQPEKVAA
jgi:hypothetical protein